MNKPTVLTVPTNETEKLDLLATRPMLWEYLLFGYYLRSGLTEHETKWRDYLLGYTLSVGPQITRAETGAAVSERMSRAKPIIANLDRVLSDQAQTAAFGEPGEPGDPEMIKHLAQRLIQSYAGLLDWADEFRSLRFDGETNLGDLGAEMVSQPIRAYRDFVEDFIVQIETALAQLATGHEGGIEMTLRITFDLEPGLTDRVIQETERVARG